MNVHSVIMQSARGLIKYSCQEGAICLLHLNVWEAVHISLVATDVLGKSGDITVT